MELLGGLLVLAVMAWVGLTICAGGLCAEQPHQDMTRPIPKAGRMEFSCWDEACDVTPPPAASPKATARQESSVPRSGTATGGGMMSG
ncbi:MAG: hypothetical protein HYY59_01630 [Candidatus Omnitrophica bacterium]|nr:hypothetical protein [Candidatus Omnitrophota bacterium]